MTEAQCIHGKKVAFWARIALVLMVLGSVGVDQVTKIVAERELMVWQNPDNLKDYQGKRYPLWSTGELTSPLDESPRFYLSFNFNYVRNQGAAWGFLSDMDDSIRIPFFYLVTCLAILMIFFYLRNTPSHHRLARFTLTLILSGAAGNFLDRVIRGYVIDFLDVRWIIPLPFPLRFRLDFFPDFLDFLNMNVNMSAWRYNFPNFNWADSTITVGVFLLLIDMIILESARKKQSIVHSSATPKAC
ncbi:MAG: signal peptidase II [Deltaproteobacteria bacterium]|nr:signal peptidase II [Deltaproteobacteria bacterium]